MKEVNHLHAAPTPAHYAAAVRDGDHLYLSGQLPLDPATRQACEGGAREQTLRALANMEALVQQEGGDRNCIVRTTAYVADMALWGEVNGAYREFFGDHHPARTIVAVPEIHFGYLVEIDGVAALPPVQPEASRPEIGCVRSPYTAIDTPSLLIDREQLEENLHWMQERADSWGVHLRPHTKTHKMPAVARMQMELGACGITTAKVGEAEVMAENGLSDIFIANEIVGVSKWQRLAELSKTCRVLFGVDSPEAVRAMEPVFDAAGALALVRIEIEVGENRSGVVSEEQLDRVLDAIAACPHVQLEGVFSHEGHTYSAPTVEACRELSRRAYERTLAFARRARERGFAVSSVSVGATPSLMHAETLPEGITELRPGTYVFMDAGQAGCLGSFDRCAATVLTTIISKPTTERLIGDAGAKALTAQSRGAGLCQTRGKGVIKGSNAVVDNVYDEHTIIYSKALHDRLQIGDKIEIIPNHICPVVNLYDRAILVSGGEAVGTLEIAGRGKLQ